jgi:glycosyltransferase involved in cell wall biosynthesis
MYSTFSVLICTYNRHKLLRKALQALIENTEEKPDQVVVVNGGDQRADRVVQSFMGRHGVEVKLIKTVNKNLAASRNVGLPHCTGDIIAMTDDDAEVFPDWVTQMKRAHREHPEAGAIGGPVLAIDNSTLAARLAEKVTFPSHAAHRRYVRTLPTVNLSYKAEVIKLLGPQDEELWTGEDVDYNWRMIQCEYKVLYDPNVKVYHSNPTTIRDLWFKHYTYGRGYYLLRSKWPDMYCIYPHKLGDLKSWLKLFNFFADIVYAPILNAISMERWLDRIVTFPVLFVNQIVWRWGILVQYYRQKQGILGR